MATTSRFSGAMYREMLRRSVPPASNVATSRVLSAMFILIALKMRANAIALHHVIEHIGVFEYRNLRISAC